MSKISRKNATRLQIIEINELLKTVLVKVPDSKFVEYKDGWGDARVAEQIKCTNASVSSVRRELFGHIRDRRESPMGAELEQVKSQLHEMRVKYHNLVMMLALNKIIDCRHLSLADMPTLSEVAKVTKIVKSA